MASICVRCVFATCHTSLQGADYLQGMPKGGKFKDTIFLVSVFNFKYDQAYNLGAWLPRPFVRMAKSIPRAHESGTASYRLGFNRLRTDGRSRRYDFLDQLIGILGCTRTIGRLHLQDGGRQRQGCCRQAWRKEDNSGRPRLVCLQEPLTIFNCCQGRCNRLPYLPAPPRPGFAHIFHRRAVLTAE